MLERGRIIEEGTHAELLASNGKYSEMWSAQAGKYN
jgi:ABC-type multidrug transport system fused ATPase/permease subunit